jgi:hypothetical protein
MKKYVFFLIGLTPMLFAMGQLNYTVSYYDWSNPTAFELSPPPVISGYGPYSDSLSQAHEGRTFYEYQDMYFLIETWADYYYWFTQKYWFCFEMPQLYEFYYLTGNNLGMASYIACNYQGRYFPTRIQIDLGTFGTDCNRLRTYAYFPATEKEVNKLKIWLAQQMNKNLQIKTQYPMVNAYSDGRVLSFPGKNIIRNEHQSTQKIQTFSSHEFYSNQSDYNKIGMNTTCGSSVSSSINIKTDEDQRNSVNRIEK